MLLFLLIAFFLVLTAPVKAENLTAQKIIQSCKNLSQSNWDSGITSKMMRGSYDYVGCLESEIEKMSHNFFLKEKDKKQFIDNIKDYRESSYSVFYSLYNGNCSPCATMYRGMHINKYAHSLEEIIKWMIQEE